MSLEGKQTTNLKIQELDRKLTQGTFEKGEGKFNQKNHIYINIHIYTYMKIYIHPHIIYIYPYIYTLNHS